MHSRNAIKGASIKAVRDPDAMKSLHGFRQRAGKLGGKRGNRKRTKKGGADTLRPRPGNAHKLRFNACKLPASTSRTSLLHYSSGRWWKWVGDGVPVVWRRARGGCGPWPLGGCVASRCVSRNCHFALEQFRVGVAWLAWVPVRVARQIDTKEWPMT